MASEDNIRERILAYISPRKPTTPAQETALENAVNAQLEYETENPQEAIPAGVTSVSNDGMSVSYADGGSRNALYTQSSLSPVAYAYLMNAGLIPGAIPRARRL
jgi:hypothetical protein